MARKPRIHIPGGLYHVTLRGNGNNPVFRIDEDRLKFEALTAEGVARFGHHVHGYCLTHTQAHLAVQVGMEPLSKVVQNLAVRYTRWFNQQKQRTGPLFQGRFKAILIDADLYLLELVRHIHLQPVSARLAANPANYFWSGHQAYLGQRQNDWLTTEWVLSRFSEDEAEARARYAGFVAEGLAERSPASFRQKKIWGGRILGGTEFIQKALGRPLPTEPREIRLESIILAVCAARNLDWETLRSPGRQRSNAEARALVAYLVSETGAATLTRAAKLLNRDVATLSNAANRVRNRLKTDAEFAAETDRLRSILAIDLKTKA